MRFFQRIFEISRAWLLLWLMLQAGRYLQQALNLPLPDSIIALCLLLILLNLGWLKKEWIAEGTRFLLRYMAILFVPVSVGVLAYRNEIELYFLPLILPNLLSTFSTLFVIGWLGERYFKRLVTQNPPETEEKP